MILVTPVSPICLRIMYCPASSAPKYPLKGMEREESHKIKYIIMIYTITKLGA